MRRLHWPGAAAAVLALCLLAGSALRAQDRAGDIGFSYGDLKEVTLQGRLVSLGEELSRKYGARMTGGGPEKQWALATPEGEYFTFLDTAGYRKLLAAGLGTRAVEISARRFPRSMLLEVQGFKALPEEAVKRTYHCTICNIDAFDFGPCACCGKELELVPDQK